MSDTFLPRDPIAAKDQIVEALYERLVKVRKVIDERASNEFDKGINFAAWTEKVWLENLIDTIERS
jgi:hypothetical protein